MAAQSPALSTCWSMRNFLLFSAVGKGARVLCRGMSEAAGLWAQTQGRLSVSDHIPPSALGVWSEDAPYGKGKQVLSSVRLCLELCGSDQAQQNTGQSPPLLFSPGQEAQPHRPQPRRSPDKGARAAHGQMAHGVLASVLSSCEPLSPTNIWPHEDTHTDIERPRRLT